MMHLVYFAIAHDEPAHAEHLIGIGLDALRMSAEPTFLAIDGAGPGDSLENLTAAKELIAELAQPVLAIPGTWVERWADIPLDAPGVLHQRFGHSCRDLRALYTHGMRASTLTVVRSALSTTLDAYLHSLSARRSGMEWVTVARAMVSDFDAYEECYVQYGGLSTMLMAATVGQSHLSVSTGGALQLTNPEASLDWAREQDRDLAEFCAAVREDKNLLSSLSACLIVALIATAMRELSDGDDALTFRSEELRRAAEEVLASCGSALLQGVLDFRGQTHSVSIARSLVHADLVKSVARARAAGARWCDLDLPIAGYMPLALAIDARSGPFVRPPRL